MNWFGLVSFFKGISSFMGYLLINILIKEELYYSFDSYRQKEVHIFPKGFIVWHGV